MHLSVKVNSCPSSTRMFICVTLTGESVNICQVILQKSVHNNNSFVSLSSEMSVTGLIGEQLGSLSYEFPSLVGDCVQSAVDSKKSFNRNRGNIIAGLIIATLIQEYGRVRSNNGPNSISNIQKQ